MSPCDPNMIFPTMADVESASQEQLRSWYRGLPAGDPTPEEREVLDRICQRFGVREDGTLAASR